MVMAQNHAKLSPKSGQYNIICATAYIIYWHITESVFSFFFLLEKNILKLRHSFSLHSGLRQQRSLDITQVHFNELALKDIIIS